MYILNIISSLFRLLDRKTKIKYIGLQIFCLMSAVIQIVGVVSIAPLIGLISNPGIIQSNEILFWAFNYLNFSGNEDFIIAFALVSIVLIGVANVFSGITLWLSFRFSIHVGSQLQDGLFHSLLGREYIYHKTHDHASAIARINQEAPRFVYMVLQPFLNLTSQLFIAVLIILGLLIFDPIVAISASLIVGGAYLVTYIRIKRSLLSHGKIITERNAKVQAILSEAFIGIKEIILGRKGNVYKKKFAYYNKRGLVSQSYIALAGDLPKLIVETIAFVAILLLAIMLLLTVSDNGDIISILSLYGLAGYKLLPAMQQVYKSLSNISAHGVVVERLIRELEFVVAYKTTPIPQNNSARRVNKIELRDISFQYPGSDRLAINSVNTLFERGRVNVIVGASGSGKTTLTDILLGLLTPSHGMLVIGGCEGDQETIRNYQRLIGYVPQHIFLTSESVFLNVAFGVESSKVDKKRVMKALELANAKEFVLGLPQGVNTELGQDGKFLSGGQRQRIGIARALYHDTKVLIFDEPTSALDINSEHEFMRNLNELKSLFLIIIVSHSPSVINMSGYIYMVQDGRLVAEGNKNELMTNSPEFIEMIGKVS